MDSMHVLSFSDFMRGSVGSIYLTDKVVFRKTPSHRIKGD